jgi:hypothetical protein
MCLDRLTQLSWDGSTTAFTWDAATASAVVDSLAGTIIRGYDMLDRLIQRSRPKRSLHRDAAGRRTS